MAQLHDEFNFVRGPREVPLMEACCNAPLRSNLIGSATVETVPRHSFAAGRIQRVPRRRRRRRCCYCCCC